MPKTILIADDDALQRKMLTNVLSKKLGYTVMAASHGKEALAIIQSSNIGDISAVILDVNMPVMDGFETLHAIRQHRPDLPVIILTGSDDTALAVKAIRDGASDFIVKPPVPAQLDIAIRNAFRLSALSRELNKMKRDKAGAIVFSDLAGYRTGLSPAILLGRKAAACAVPVLITGETGTGKELLARAIHGESKRVGAPFVAVNCSAVQDHLVESMLFHTDTGALRKAENGTLFLDDVDTLPEEAQIRLLRVLQYKEIEPIGSGKPMKVNVRIIAASERDLAYDVKAGRFREDLYFRLNVLSIPLLPLRQRSQDIAAITEYFIDRLSASEGLLPKTFTPEAKNYLTQQSWPGNVRELENLIHRTLVLSDDPVIDTAILEEIHEASGKTAPAERRATSPLHINMRHPDGNFKTMDEMEKEALHMALNHFNHNMSQAADAVGMARSTFYRKIKESLQK